jgi:hypothetical protein
MHVEMEENLGEHRVAKIHGKVEDGRDRKIR